MLSNVKIIQKTKKKIFRICPDMKLTSKMNFSKEKVCTLLKSLWLVYWLSRRKIKPHLRFFKNYWLIKKFCFRPPCLLTFHHCESKFLKDFLKYWWWVKSVKSETKQKLSQYVKIINQRLVPNLFKDLVLL